MKRKSMVLGAAFLAATFLGATGMVSAAPLGAAGAALPEAAQARADDAASGLIVQTQGRRRVVGGRVGGGRNAFGGGGPGWRGGGRGLSTGAAIGLGVGAATLGILGAAAAAGAADAPVYGGCYIVRQPVYDDWGNYLGRRRMRVCD